MLRAAILGAVLACVWLPAAAQAQAAKPTTPELIDRALATGAISDERANQLRVYALSGDSRLPASYASDTPWRGTALARQVEQAGALRAPQDDPNPARCFNLTGIQSVTSDHFYIQYTAVSGGPTIQDYADSLDAAWDQQVTAFGWAEPPIDAILEGKYHVVVAPLGPALYGLVTTNGTYAGDSGDNPDTSWNDGDAASTCMVLNSDFDAFPGTAQAALDATTAHEFNHSLQYGYGALDGANSPDIAFPEGGATWMEDEVQDAANDNYNYLYPQYESSMGEHAGNEYAYWLTFRGLTERFGTNAAGAGEQVMQDYWERISRFQTEGSLTALDQALRNKGSSLPAAYHDYAIAARYLRTCTAQIALPFCFEEGSDYVTAVGAEPDAQQAIAAAGGSASGTVEDNYALNWVDLPIGAYNLTLSKPAAGGVLRATVVCETAAQLLGVRIATPVTGTGSATIPGLDTAGCTATALVITNESQTAGDPTSSEARAYNVTTAAAPAATTPGALAPTPDPPPPNPTPNPAPTPGPGGATGSTADTTGPLLSLVSLSRRRFRAFGSGPGISARRGTRVRYRLSERSSVRVRLQRRTRPGRWVTVRGSAIDRGVAGVNSFRFSGRWKRKRLAPGSYRLRLQAKDGSGNLSSVRTTRSLRIVRR